MELSGQSPTERSPGKHLEYNVTVLQLLQQLHLQLTDMVALHKMKSREEIIATFVELLTFGNDQAIEAAQIAAELCAIPLFHFCIPNVISLPLTCVLLHNWRQLLIDIATESQSDLRLLVERTLQRVSLELPGLSESMIGLLRTFFLRCSLPFVSLYSTVLHFKTPARQLVNDIPLSLSVSTIPPLSDFIIYEAALAEHDALLRQATHAQETTHLSPEIALRELEGLTREDERSLLLRTKRAPTEAMLRAQKEAASMGAEDAHSERISKVINEEHRARKEEQDYTEIVTQKLRTPTEAIARSLLDHRKQLAN